MSIIFGCVKAGGSMIQEPELRHLGVATQKYATGAQTLIVTGRVGMGFQPYHSHRRSILETRPVKDKYGHLLSMDGRLDNYAELAADLGLSPNDALDSEIMLAAFASWGEDCFSRFTGDWAIALWSQKDETLYLARDHAGTRRLYFRRDGEDIAWSTQLDTFWRIGTTLRMSPEYAARYLASRPVRNLTPYSGIFAVQPAHYVRIQNGCRVERAHWRPTSGGIIRYGSDAEYEAHFLDLFQQSIARRIGPGAPILAELSGGMDSSSIVCVSDHLRRESNSEAELLDTVSYFDDSEPSLNDRPYFSLVEASRGKTGIHIDTAFSRRTFQPHDGHEGAYQLPGADSSSLELERCFQNTVWSKGYRSILSGIGGDELLGGVPNALPELSSYVTSGNVGKLFRQSIAWSVANRTTLTSTLCDTLAYLTELYAKTGGGSRAIPPWLSLSLCRRNLEFEREHPPVPSRLGFAPYQLDNALGWWSIMETLPHQFHGLLCRPEYRYPFLDKDLVHFLFSIPRDQLLRPNRRRYLMRRALVGIVPHEILERRQKAFQLAAPLKKIAAAQSILASLFQDSALARHGFVESSQLAIWLQRTVAGDPTWWQALVKTISFELWLTVFEQQQPQVVGDVAECSPSHFDRSPAVAKIRMLQPRSN